MKKLFTALFALLITLGASAQVEPADNGVYYLYDAQSGMFLTRGATWGTQAITSPVGLPWKVSVANGTYTLRMYDLTLDGWTNGLGSNGYSDNGEPIAFTPAGDAATGYTLASGENYLTAPVTAGGISFSATATTWQFLTAQQYTAVLAAKKTADEASIAAKAGVDLTNTNLDAIMVAGTSVNDGVPTATSWTNWTVSNRGGTPGYGTYGTEIFQFAGGFNKTITGLSAGIYKLKVRGLKRINNNANCVTMANNGFHASDAYMEANGSIIPVKAWSEDRVSDSNPNNTGDFETLVSQGKYISEGYVYVGDDGKLDLNVHSEAWFMHDPNQWNGCWFLFNGVEYAHCSDPSGALREVIVEAEALNVAPIGTEVQAALVAAITAAQGNLSSFADYSNAIAALQTAINNVKTWKAAYAEAVAPLAAALDRFAANYKNDDGTAKQAMSAGAWQTLLTAVNTATTAKDVTNSYDGFAAATTALNNALEAADNSIALWSRYTNLKNGLNSLNAAILTGMADNNATDDEVSATLTAMDNAAETWLKAQGGNVNVGALLGENLDFETAQGDADATYANVHEIPGWNNSFNTKAASNNLGYIHRRQVTDDKAEGSTNSLYMRAKWQDIAATVQIAKTAVLPKGNYELKVWMKNTASTGTNLCYYQIGDQKTMLTAGSTWEQKSIALSIDEAQALDLSFGFVGGNGSNEFSMWVDDITLNYLGKTLYRTALEAAQAAYGNDESKLALKSALGEFTFSETEEAAKTSDEIATAIAVLNNAVTINNNNNEATTLWKNADFSGGTVSHAVKGDGGQVVTPADWNFEYDFAGWNDTKMNNGAFNLWAGTINRGELYQKVTYLPNGTYKISADVETDQTNASSLIALYGNVNNGNNIGRSENIYYNDANTFVNHSVYVNVDNHELTAGIRTDKGYFQMKGFKVEFVAPNAAETANGLLYQAAYVVRNDLNLDLTSFTDARGCEVYVAKANALIRAAQGAVSNANNVIVNGTCANLVIADGQAFRPAEAFTATNVSYARELYTADGDWNSYYAAFDCALPEGVKAYEYTEMNAAGDAMTVEEVNSLTAGKAYLMQSTEANVTFTATNAAISAFAEPVADGLFGSTDVYNVGEQTDIYMLASDNMWHPANANSSSKPFRACFKQAAANSRLRIVIGGQTGISEMADPMNGKNATIYTLGGQAVNRNVNNLRPGVYVINQKKVIIK